VSRVRHFHAKPALVFDFTAAKAAKVNGGALAHVIEPEPEPCADRVAPPATAELLRLRVVEVMLSASHRLRALGDECGARPLESLGMLLMDEYRLVRRRGGL
jgi:hypothetical protein